MPFNVTRGSSTSLQTASDFKRSQLSSPILDFKPIWKSTLGPASNAAFDWRESVFANGIPSDAVKFWVGILEYRNLLGNGPFWELANYALSCLTTPISNAVVERIFSYVTSIKTKPRNRTSTVMRETIIRIRTHLSFKNKCCKDFGPSTKMLSLFNTYNLCQTVRANEAADDELNSSYVWTRIISKRLGKM